MNAQEETRISLDRFRATDCDELNELSVVRGWQTDYQQLGPGKFSVQFDLALTPRLVLSDKSCNTRMLHVAHTPADYKVVIMPLGSGEASKLFGNDISSGCIGLVNGHTDVFYQAPKTLRMLVATIPMDLLAQTAFPATLSPAIEKAVFGNSVLEIGDKSCLRLVHIISQMMNHIGSIPTSSASKTSLLEFEEYFVHSLIQAIKNSQSNWIEGRGNRNQRMYASRARDYINGHLSDPIGITTLAKEVGISQRSLESSFRECFGITPVNYIKVRRLNAARNKLLHANPNENVASVAETNGFSHLSRFAGDYHNLFSEYPSETLPKALASHLKTDRSGVLDCR